MVNCHSPKLYKIKIAPSFLGLKITRIYHGRFDQYFLKINFFYIPFNLNIFFARNSKLLRDSAIETSMQIDASL